MAVSPQGYYRQELMAGFILANRILGFINAPALMQRVVAKVAGLCVDTAPYARRRDLLAQILSEAGHRFALPRGPFHFFPRGPGRRRPGLREPPETGKRPGCAGPGFGREGYFRPAFCVPKPSSPGPWRASPGGGVRGESILGEDEGASGFLPSPKPPPNPLRVLPEPRL